MTISKPLIIIAIINTLLYGDVEIPHNKCALIVASRATLSEAKTYINTEIDNKRYVNVYRANNGWFAISRGFLKNSEAQSVLRKWKRSEKIPQDSFCAKANKFTEEIDIYNTNTATTTRQTVNPSNAKELALHQKRYDEYKASMSDGTVAYQTKIDSETGNIIKLENGAIIEVSSYFGYLGYRKSAVLYGSNNRCNIWIAGKKSYRCELLKSPYGKGSPAKSIYISMVKGNGTILMMLDGSIYEVDSFDTINTSLWLGGSDGLLINGTTLINFDSDEAVTVSQIR